MQALFFKLIIDIITYFPLWKLLFINFYLNTQYNMFMIPLSLIIKYAILTIKVLGEEYDLCNVIKAKLILYVGKA